MRLEAGADEPDHRPGAHRDAHHHAQGLDRLSSPPGRRWWSSCGAGSWGRIRGRDGLGLTGASGVRIGEQPQYAVPSLISIPAPSPTPSPTAAPPADPPGWPGAPGRAPPPPRPGAASHHHREDQRDRAGEVWYSSGARNLPRSRAIAGPDGHAGSHHAESVAHHRPHDLAGATHRAPTGCRTPGCAAPRHTTSRCRGRARRPAAPAPPKTPNIDAPRRQGWISGSICDWKVRTSAQRKVGAMLRNARRTSGIESRPDRPGFVTNSIRVRLMPAPPGLVQRHVVHRRGLLLDRVDPRVGHDAHDLGAGKAVGARS